MPRNKSMTKSRWRQKDKEYREQQNARARANRERRALNQRRLEALEAGLPWPPVEEESE